MAGLSQLNPNLRLGFQPPKSSPRSTRTAAAIPVLSRWSFNTAASSPLPRFSFGANFLLKKKNVHFHNPNSDRFPVEKLIQVKATDSSSSSNETETTPKGPPFLTILAGAIVFLLFCWVVGSLVIWLVSPVVNLFISK